MPSAGFHRRKDANWWIGWMSIAWIWRELRLHPRSLALPRKSGAISRSVHRPAGRFLRRPGRNWSRMDEATLERLRRYIISRFVSHAGRELGVRAKDAAE